MTRSTAVLFYNGRETDLIVLVHPEITGNFRLAVEPPLADPYEVEWKIEGEGLAWEQTDPDGINRLTVTSTEPFEAHVYARAWCEHGFYVESQRVRIVWRDYGPEDV